MAVFGNSTSKEVEKQGLTINIKVPAPGITSMATALEKYLEISNKDL
jgi:uroporphyrinogen-III synthase